MAIFDGRFKVEMNLWGPNMTVFDGQLMVIIRSPKSTSGDGLSCNRCGRELLRGHDASFSASTFSEAIVSLFKGKRCLGKWHADSDLAPLMLGQHVSHH